MTSNSRGTFWKGLATLSIMLMEACDSQKAPENYGLATLQIFMDSETISRLNMSVFDKVDYPAEVSVNGKQSSARISYAGKTSIDALKKNLNISLSDGEVFQGMRKFRLSASTSDNSLLRNFLGFRVFSLAGLPVPHVEPVALYFNDHYLGLYVLIEPIDGDFFLRRGLQATSVYKAQHSNHDLDLSILNIIRSAFKGRTGLEIWTDLERFVQAMNSTEREQGQAIEKVLNLDSFFVYVAVSVLLDNWDGFENNYVLYRRKSSAQFEMAPWDLDATLQGREVGSLGEGHFCSQILDREEFARRYRRIVNETAGKIRNSDIYQDLAALAQSMQPAYQADRILAASGQNPQEHLRFLLETFDKRIDFVLGEINR